MMLEEFTSPMVAELKANANVIKRGELTVKLAQDFGFCWGVERAVAMSFQVRRGPPSLPVLTSRL